MILCWPSVCRCEKLLLLLKSGVKIQKHCLVAEMKLKMSLLHIELFQFQLCHQVAIFYFDLTFPIYWPLVKNASFRFFMHHELITNIKQNITNDCFWGSCIAGTLKSSIFTDIYPGVCWCDSLPFPQSTIKCHFLDWIPMPVWK